MTRLSRLVLIFSLAFTVLIISPAFLSSQFGLYDRMKTGDATDILTPIILIPLYWLLYQIDQDKTVSSIENVIFLIVVAFWVEGQGMHLSANSIGHQLKGMESSDAYKLTEFYDEVLSHYLWHLGVVGLSALLLWRQWKNPFNGEHTLWLASIAGLVYGFTYFITITEAQTAPLGVPFAALVILFVGARGRKELRKQPLLTFFATAYVLALVLFVGWALYWQGSDCSVLLPEFSDSCVGIIE